MRLLHFLVDGQCFEDNLISGPGLRYLPYRAHFSSTNTIESCKKACFENNYKYAGVQFTKGCWCGNNAPRKVAKESECKMDCPGDKSQKCGGSNRMNVYQNPGISRDFCSLYPLELKTKAIRRFAKISQSQRRLEGCLSS